MKVRELIELLGEQDPDLVVEVGYSDDEQFDSSRVIELQVCTAAWLDGRPPFSYLAVLGVME